MIYGRMMTRAHLISHARIALTPLFQAYDDWRRRGIAWRQQMARELIFNNDELRQEFDKMQQVGMYPIAACIALLSDNVGRTYVRERLRMAELERVNFGAIIRPEIRFGKVLWCAANAARHYDGEALNPWNEAVLREFGIEARDEQAAFLLLEGAGVIGEADLLQQLEVMLDDMDRPREQEQGVNA
jgi:hypothetical protein